MTVTSASSTSNTGGIAGGLASNLMNLFSSATNVLNGKASETDMAAVLNQFTEVQKAQFDKAPNRETQMQMVHQKAQEIVQAQQSQQGQSRQGQAVYAKPQGNEKMGLDAFGLVGLTISAVRTIQSGGKEIMPGLNPMMFTAALDIAHINTTRGTNDARTPPTFRAGAAPGMARVINP